MQKTVLQALLKLCGGRMERPERNKKEEKTESERCFSSALLILKSADNSSKMLREKLSRKGYSAESIEYSLEKARGAGLVNDERLLKRYVLFLAEKKFFGPLRIRAELARRFDREIISDLFCEATEEIDFSLYAYAFAEKQKNKDINSLAARLKRQGYYSEHIRYAVREIRKTIMEED